MESPESSMDLPGPSSPSQVVPESEVVCVEFPAFVRNVDKAINMLGGHEAVSIAENSKNPFLQLHWKPNDPLRRGIYGGRHLGQGLLLRLSKPKSGNAGSGEFKAEVVGRVKATYKFEGMCDYGFGKKEELPDRETWIPGTMELGETSESLAVLPPLFSKVDLPLDYAFKLGKPILSNKEHAKRYDMLYGGMSRNTRISFFSLGGVPEPKQFKSIDPKTKECWDFVQEKLDERPIWSIEMLTHVVNGRWERPVVFAVLVGLSYKFRTGPWHNLFVRRGYDPRKDAGARKYQKIDYEFPQWDSSSRQRRMPRGMCLPKSSLDDLHRFAALPKVLNSTFQVCDFEDPEISNMVEEGYQRPVHCSVESGWFPEDQWKRIVKTVNNRFGFLFDSQVEQYKSGIRAPGEKIAEILPPELLDQVLADMHSDDGSLSSEGEDVGEVALDQEDQDEDQDVDQEDVIDMEIDDLLDFGPGNKPK